MGLISREEALLWTTPEDWGTPDEVWRPESEYGRYIQSLPSAEQEKTVYIPDTKAIPTSRSCVDLAEEVTATFYDEEHEEWTQRKVTIADVLDSVCDEYTILPSAERVGHWIEDDDATVKGHCSVCGWESHYYEDDVVGMSFCPNCGAKMEGEESHKPTQAELEDIFREE